MTPGEPVRGEAPDGRARPDEHALAVLGMDQALPLEDREGVPHRHTGNPVVLHQLSFRGQLLPLPEPATIDGLAKLIGDLSKDRTITRGVESAKNARKRRHVDYSFRYLDEWASAIATVESLAIRRGRGT